MPSVSETIQVAAMPEAAFSFVADAPARATMFIPGLNRINNVTTEKAGVDQSRCTRYERPSSYQFKTVTGNPSTWTYRFEPKDGGTGLTLEVEYELPQNQLARFATAGTLEQMNRNRVREIVANLKAMIEP
jgi:hypothetical protein